MNAVQRFLYIFGQFIHPSDHKHMGGSGDQTGHPVSVSVDVDQLAVGGKSVGAGEKIVGADDFSVQCPGVFGSLCGGPVNTLIGACFYGVQDAGLGQSDGTAPGDGRIFRNQFQDFFDGLRACGAVECVDVAGCKFLDHGFAQMQIIFRLK